MSDTEYPDDEGLVVLLRNEIDQLRARAEKAEADLAVVVEVLRRAGAATITVPCNWRTVAVANTHGLGFVRAVDTSTDEHDVLRRLLTEEQP